ncbi:MAG: HlyC/CorC family transporter [Chlorobiales bacterium]|jgi:putative hemolysin|nr:HlyC/CorC family transporter [Chlorobiales bacterium]
MWEFFILVSSLILSAFFSGAEIVFISVNQIRVQVFERKRFLGAGPAGFFIRNIDKVLLTTLVGANVALIIYAFALADLINRVIGESRTSFHLVIITVVASIVAVFIGQVIPRLWLKTLADYAVLVIAPFLKGFYIISYPVLQLVERFTSWLVGSFGKAPVDIKQFFGKQDLDVLLRETSQRVDKQTDEEIISNIFAVSEVRVKESMVPRTEIYAIAQSAAMKDVYQEFISSGYSRLPVINETIDCVVGVVTVHDLYKRPKSLKSIMRDVMFVPETKKSVELLQEFVRTGQNMAIVVDEFGGTAGIVTSEDLIEELIGDIQDEFDTDEDICRAVSENTFLISARLDIDTINERLKVGLSKEDNYETLAGYILSHIGRIPKQGEIFKIDNFVITVARATNTKINVVKLKTEHA